MASQQEVVERIFDAALSLDPAERETFLDRECAGVPEIRRVVEELLADDARAGSFLQHPPFEYLDKAALFEQLLAGETASLGSPACVTSPHPAEQLNPGQVLLNRFEVVRFIAKGGMGEVYEAEDRSLQHTHIALKTILPRIAHDPSLRGRFEREVLLARELTHTNLCPIYDIFPCDEPTPGFLFLTMKLLPGTTLAKRLQLSPPLTPEEKLAIVQQISAGLVAIHDGGIVHRDIKPSNIMLDGSRLGLRIWITDFGLARALESETTLQNHGVAGTPGYIAPELDSGHAPSHASDLYAFGVVLHELFTGEKPDTGPNGAAVASPELKSSGAPSFCIQLVRGCLDIDPKRRCGAFDHALVDLGLKRRPRKPWTRRQFITTAAGGVCALGGMGWWERDNIDNLLNPIPQKRFVALLSWPKTTDSQVTPMLTGALSAIKNELSRIEAFERNLFVVTPDEVNKDLAKAEHLKEVCEPLGANLVLAASGVPGAKHFELLLRLLNPLGQLLRQKSVICARTEITSMPDKAVHATASLLSLGRYLKATTSSDAGTRSVPAYIAFQSAETSLMQPNDNGIDAAIAKYKEAIELDPRYAIAYAKLAIAYGRLYALHRDPAALDLARRNSDVALRLDPNLVQAYLARTSILDQTGDNQGALQAIERALALDPSNPRAMVWQGQVYTHMGRWAQAEHSFKRVIDERPNYWMAYNELGQVLIEQARYPEATKAFRSACLAAPGNALAFNNLGATYLLTGNFSEATDSFKKSLLVKPNGMAAANTSFALRSQGKVSEAIGFALRAVQLEPTNDANWMELADCYSSLPGHHADATAAYARAAKEAEQHVQMNPNDGPTWMALALYRLKSENAQQSAAALIRKAETLGAADINSQLIKAQILEDLGKRDEAIDTLASCFEKGVTQFAIEPVSDFRALRKDPRYQALARPSADRKQGRS